MLQILLIIAPLFLIILLGFVLTKTKIVNEQWEGVLNAFALKIGLPALIFAALISTDFSFLENRLLILVTVLFLAITFLVAYIFGKIFRLSGKTTRSIFISLGFGNIAYLGIPVLARVSGQEILPAVGLAVGIYLFMIFTFGIGYLEYSSRKNYKKLALSLVKNPSLIAVILGIIIGVLKIPFPNIILDAVDMVALSVTPVVLITIGLFLGKVKLNKLGSWITPAIYSAITLMVLPAAVYFGAPFFGIDFDGFFISVVLASMPLAITPFALSKEYDLDKDFIARSIVLSTVLSIFTIPFWITIVGTSIF